MKIGEFAKRAGVSIQTVRFYEREGLIAAPGRTVSGYRDYGMGDIERLRVIRVCQEIGFTLNDVRDVLEPHRILAQRSAPTALKPAAREKMLASARKRLETIEEKLAVRRKMRTGMRALVATLSRDETPVCPASARNAGRTRRSRAAASA
jgi:MerR family copper efflux transcriptional regulator